VDAAQGEKAWAVDDLVDALVKMRGKAKKKLAVRRLAVRKRAVHKRKTKQKPS
jgi:hypothetical protein